MKGWMKLLANQKIAELYPTFVIYGVKWIWLIGWLSEDFIEIRFLVQWFPSVSS